MSIRHLILVVLAALTVSGCATKDPMPFQAGTDCFYPACAVNVEVVDDGKGGKKLRADGDGNVRMGTRHKLVAIVWNLKTPGYEFRGDSLQPYSTATTKGKPTTPYGVWSQEIQTHGYWSDSISVTNMNNERRMLHYDLVVYPSFGTAGGPLSLDAAIMNDPCPYPGWICR